MGIDGVKDIGKLKANIREKPENVKNFKRRKISEDEEEPILIRIDRCDTDSPTLTYVKIGKEHLDSIAKNQDQESKDESDESDDPFQIPDSSILGVKSRSASEKSVNEKNLSMSKLPSDISNSTMCTPTIKSAEKVAKSKDGKSFDLTNASVQYNENEENARLKDFELTDNIKVEKPTIESSFPLKLNMFNEAPQLQLEAPEHSVDFFPNENEMKNIEEYPEDKLEFPNSEYDLSQHESINKFEPEPDNEPLESLGHAQIGEFDHKLPSENYPSEFFSGMLINDNQNDEFKLECDITKFI